MRYSIRNTKGLRDEAPFLLVVFVSVGNCVADRHYDREENSPDGIHDPGVCPSPEKKAQGKINSGCNAPVSEADCLL